MGKLSDDEIRNIIQKASLLQKFSEQSPATLPDTSDPVIQNLFEITNELGIQRKFVQEAYLESAGIPIHEPLIVDNNDFNSAEVVGFARGRIDNELLGELKAQLEYHFNTLGKISHRKDKIVWKAKPVGPSKMIASSTSPEVSFEQVDGNTKISVRQSLKTVNKLYLPGVAAAFGGFMLFAAVLFDQVGNEVAPLLIFSGLILLGSLFYTRFVNGRRKKKKEKLQELVETLQGKVERHLKASFKNSKEESQAPEIEIPGNEHEEKNKDGISPQKLKE